MAYAATEHPEHKGHNETKTPFTDAEEAWFWFIAAQEARDAGARIRAGSALLPRPCEPLDILKCVDRLYRNRVLGRDHLLVLRHYGRRRLRPDSFRAKEMRAHRLWMEAFDRLTPLLVKKGIVREAPPKGWADDFLSRHPVRETAYA